MELWACGLNAWNQLEFDREPPLEPRDLLEFKCVLKDEHIEVLWMSLSATLVKISSGSHLAGSPDDSTRLCYDRTDNCRLATTAVAGNEKVTSLPDR